MHEHVMQKLKASWEKLNPNLTALVSLIKHTSNKCMKHYYSV